MKLLKYVPDAILQILDRILYKEVKNLDGTVDVHRGDKKVYTYFKK